MHETHSRPTFAEMLRVFARIGCLSFGGPAGQIALMHRELVDERRWIDEDQYLAALNFCHLLPGPEAQQLATWIGWKLHGTRGGLASGLLFVMPGAFVILALSLLYGYAANLGWVAAVFLGIKAAVLAIVVQALLRIAGRALQTPFKRGLAVAAFVALFFLDLPFPAVMLAAAALGMVAATWRPGLLALKPASGPQADSARPWGASLRAALVWGVIWVLPLCAVILTLGPDHVLWKIGLFFSKLALVTFGGAYAVLSYMAQQSVDHYAWLTAREMTDGLGLAETTPGPLIMVTQFVGYLAAFRAPEPFTPLVAGILGAALTTWVTFAPCFLWIFALAPWFERLQAMPRLAGALAAVTAAVVGVIANLTLWIALHVLFARVTVQHWGPVRLQSPDWGTLDAAAAALALLAAWLVFVRRWGVPQVLMLAATAGFAISLPAWL